MRESEDSTNLIVCPWDAKVGFDLLQSHPSLVFLIVNNELKLTRKFTSIILNTKKKRCGNDPSAGSPTETLLRLHLPLNDEV